VMEIIDPMETARTFVRVFRRHQHESDEVIAHMMAKAIVEIEGTPKVAFGICTHSIPSSLTGTGFMRCTSIAGHPGVHRNGAHTWEY